MTSADIALVIGIALVMLVIILIIFNVIGGNE